MMLPLLFFFLRMMARPAHPVLCHFWCPPQVKLSLHWRPWLKTFVSCLKPLFLSFFLSTHDCEWMHCIVCVYMRVCVCVCVSFSILCITHWLSCSCISLLKQQPQRKIICPMLGSLTSGINCLFCDNCCMKNKYTYTHTHTHTLVLTDKQTTTGAYIYRQGPVPHVINLLTVTPRLAKRGEQAGKVGRQEIGTLWCEFLKIVYMQSPAGHVKYQQTYIYCICIPGRNVLLALIKFACAIQHQLDIHRVHVHLQY